MVTHSTTYKHSPSQLSYTSRDKQQPQIKSEGTVTNSGFRSKSVTVTYQQPVMADTYLGEIPLNHPITADTGFDYSIITGQEEDVIASSKESPNLPPWTNSTERIYRKKPVLDAAGKPKMETITKNFKVPGTKGLILGQLATSAAIGAVVGGLSTAVSLGFYLGWFKLGSLLGLSPALAGGSAALWSATKAVAVGGALLSVGKTLIDERKKLFEPVKFQWSKTDITSPGKLTGYRVGHPINPGWINIGFAEYYPKFSDSTKHGEWSKPSIQWGSEELPSIPDESAL